MRAARWEALPGAPQLATPGAASWGLAREAQCGAAPMVEPAELRGSRGGAATPPRERPPRGRGPLTRLAKASAEPFTTARREARGRHGRAATALGHGRAAAGRLGGGAGAAACRQRPALVALPSWSRGDSAAPLGRTRRALGCSAHSRGEPAPRSDLKEQRWCHPQPSVPPTANASLPAHHCRFYSRGPERRRRGGPRRRREMSRQVRLPATVASKCSETTHDRGARRKG